MHRLTVLAALVACSSRAGAPAPERVANDVGVDAAAPEQDRCLPVVAADCGCVWGCGIGTPLADGRYQVIHEHWASTITAHIDQWCVDGECTAAFFGDIVCDGICSPSPADPTCHFVGHACRSEQP